VLEITGLFFAVFALMGIGAAWRQWTRLQSGEPAASSSHVAVALGFSAVFLYFSVTSFLKARRLSSAAEENGNG
jgi:predicted membrane metal-binding protein